MDSRRRTYSNARLHSSSRGSVEYHYYKVDSRGVRIRINVGLRPVIFSLVSHVFGYSPTSLD